MIRFGPLLISLMLIAGLATIGVMRLDIETDIVRSLPTGDKVLAEAAEVFQKHPIHDQIAVDLALNEYNPALLADCADRLQQAMEQSGLFSQVGFSETGVQIQEVAAILTRQLPVSFSADQLKQQIAPLLDPGHITARLRLLREQLGSLEGIGQERTIAADPLGLKDLVLARLAPLMPTDKVNFFRGHLLSPDGRHLLLTATPATSGTDSDTARRIADLIQRSTATIKHTVVLGDRELTITPVGAYRAALDNERIIRRDVRLAIGLATLGIAVLLLLSFPRPVIGLTALLPAFAGTAAALFCYSLIHPTISVMVLGFGGALISITVDHGISYLLFLDRPVETRGKDASHEAWAIGIMAVLTSIGAFIILSFSPFPIFTQLGHFTALGILFSFLFVHTVLPWLFPIMPPAGDRTLPIQALASRLYNPSKTVAITTALATAGLLFIAMPHFHVQLSSMNTVSRETAAADDLFTAIWGTGRDRVIVMHSASSIDAIQQNSDTLLDAIEQDVSTGVLSGAFVPSMLFPGPQRREQNLHAWHTFWDDQRRRSVTQAIVAASRDLGFSDTAFSGFLALLDDHNTPSSFIIPASCYQLLGIATDPETGSLVQFTTALPGRDYRASAFLQRYAAFGIVFDTAFFTERLASVLFSTFVTMLTIVAAAVTVMVALFYLNIRLTLLTLLPVVFAYICTMATLNALGRPLDIPALMLAVVIFGMGIDYAIIFVRAFQRYRDPAAPPFILATSTIVLAAASTLIGFGALCFADHALLRSIGITSTLGLAYSLLGTFLLLPPLLSSYFSETPSRKGIQAASLSQRVNRRYKTVEAYPRLFARFKMRFDPLLAELNASLAGRRDIGTILDIGCGYGVPACWCLEQFGHAIVYGIDPDREKIRIAAIAAGSRGTMTCGRAPDLPPMDRPADIVLLLDMLHYLSDDKVRSTLASCRRALAPDGLLVTRFVTVPPTHPSWAWRLEHFRTRNTGVTPAYRTPDHLAALFREADLTVQQQRISSTNPELAWVIGRAEASTDVSLQQEYRAVSDPHDTVENNDRTGSGVSGPRPQPPM